MKNNNKAAIEVKNLSKKFGKFYAVKDASFNVSRGKIHGFIGPNGAGKTTTLKAMIGAYYKTQGQIYVDGFKAGTVKAKTRARYIPERASFPPYMNCLEYLVSMAQLAGLKQKEAFKTAGQILKDLNLYNFRFKKPSSFSSGMKKKILVAQAMIIKPTILILDEPAANLDPTARQELFTMFKEIAKTGCSILISSHILAELQDIIEEVTFISQGQIRYSGKVSDLISENGVLISFVNKETVATKAFIKKHKLISTTSGMKATTKTHTAATNIVKDAMTKKIPIISLSFINQNLSVAYDKLVLKYENSVDEGEK